MHFFGARYEMHHICAGNILGTVLLKISARTRLDLIPGAGPERLGRVSNTNRVNGAPILDLLHSGTALC